MYINNSLYVTGTHQDLSYAWADAEDISFAVEANDKIDIIYNASSTPWDYYLDAYKVFDTQGNLIRVVSNQGDSIPLANSQRIYTCPNYTEPRPNLTISPKKDKYYKNSSFKSSNKTKDAINELLVYPNPTKNSSLISFSLIEKSNVKIEITDVSGKVVHSKYFHNSNQGQYAIEINVTDLNNGLYFVNLHANGELRSKKLTIAK